MRFDAGLMFFFFICCHLNYTFSAQFNIDIQISCVWSTNNIADRHKKQPGHIFSFGFQIFYAIEQDD